MRTLGLLSVAVLAVLSSCGGGTQGTPATQAENAPGVRRVGALQEENLRPFPKSDGSRFRVAVVQSGEFYAYVEVFVAILEGLRSLGWIGSDPMPEVFDVPATEQTMGEIIGHLARRSDSGYLEFRPELFFDFNWDDEAAGSPSFRELLSGAIDADLIVSLGTTAGVIVSSAQDIRIPILVEGASDPVGSGIVVSVDDSGRDNLTASLDPDIYARQVRLFYDLVGFRRLGIIYTDTDVGRSYAALADVERLSQEYGFEIVAATDVMEDPPDERDIPKAEAMYRQALEELAPKVDAVYLAFQAGLTLDNVPAILSVVARHRLPTFAMEGSEFVRRGILFGESISEIETLGLYNAGKIVQIFKGRGPRDLNQIYEHVPHIALNLQGATLIGYDIPVDILPSADEIYRTIE